MFFKKKGGQIQTDMILLVLVLLILGVSAVVGSLVFNNINSQIQDDSDMSVIAKTTTNTLNNNYSSIFDNVFIMFLVLFWIMLLATSLFIDSHPIFFAITIILLIFLLLIGMVISNVYQDVTSDSDLSSVANNFTKTKWVFNHFLIVFIIIGLSTGLAMYSKSWG